MERIELAVRPDGRIDPSRTQISDVYGTFKDRLFDYPFPPSTTGSADLFCNNVRVKEHGQDTLELRCRER